MAVTPLSAFFSAADLHPSQALLTSSHKTLLSLGDLAWRSLRLFPFQFTFLNAGDQERT